MREDLSSTDTPPHAESPRREITPELVRQVAERVFALLVADLKIERERRRAASPRIPGRQGGS